MGGEPDLRGGIREGRRAALAGAYHPGQADAVHHQDAYRRHRDYPGGNPHIPWYTLTDDFDAEVGVDEWHGTNAFIREGDRIFRTYFVNGRGDEVAANTWSYLDLTALGRQEEWEDSPEGYPQTPPYVWWKWHDAYDTEPSHQEHLEQTTRALEARGGSK